MLTSRGATKPEIAPPENVLVSLTRRTIPYVMFIGFVAGTSIGVIYCVKTGWSPKEIGGKIDYNDNSTAWMPPVSNECSVRGTYFDEDKGVCTTCPNPTKKYSVFWETQTGGCKDFLNSDSAKYVTHIYWSFALLNPDTGEVIPSFQGNDDALKECIQMVRKRCIRNYASIGGATMNKEWIAINTDAKIDTFGKTGAKLMKLYGFDGADIDDESGNALAQGNWKKNAAPNVKKYLKSLRKNFDALPRDPLEPPYYISWDEFPWALDPSRCNNPGAEYDRCWDNEITNIVDDVNLMLYNSASGQYDLYLNDYIPNRWAKQVPPKKLYIGTCAFDGCSTDGDRPTNAQMQRYASDGSSKYGGSFLWTGSKDWAVSKGQTMTLMGKAGGYSNGFTKNGTTSQ